MITVWVSACSTTKVVNDEGLRKSSAAAGEIVPRIPNYTQELSAVSGKGKALVSEPDHSERVTVYFSSNRSKSLVTVRNNLGIEGGQLLADSDSLLIYNKVDKFARRISITEGNLSRLDHLASVNILDMMNYTFSQDDVLNIYENDQTYLFRLSGGSQVYVDKSDFVIRRVDQPRGSGLPYSRIEYDAYSKINGFRLPRRVTIISSDGKSKVDLLVQSLQVNPGDLNLHIDIPDNITIVTR